MATKDYRIAAVAFPTMLIAGLAAWLLFFDPAESDAETPAPTPVSVTPAPDAAQDQSESKSQNQSQRQPDAAPAPPQQGPVGSETANPLGRLRIARQSFQRGGLGSKALVTLTLRNDNAYAVKDPEILCSFRSPDGRYSTERRRTIHDTVDTRSRKTLPQTLVGFINIRASLARCSLLTASRG